MALRTRRADNHLTGAEWTEHFHRLLTRCGGVCEARTPACLVPVDGRLDRIPRERVSVQHRRAQGAGGTSLEATNFLDNLLLICGTGTTGCHGWMETQEREAARSLGFVLDHTYVDGRPVQAWRYPVRIWGGRWRVLDPFVVLYEELPVRVQYAREIPVVWGGADRY